jgi:hypothetical protein
VEKPKPPWLPIIIGAVILVLVLGVVGYLVFKPSPTPPVAGKSPSPVPSPTPESGINAFSGDWRNADPNTRSIVRAIISPASPSSAALHLFGACSPTPCDWGTTNAPLSDNPQQLNATYNPGFVIETVTITRSGGQLVVRIHSHFTDNSGRKDYDSTDVMNRSLNVKTQVANPNGGVLTKP